MSGKIIPIILGKGQGFPATGPPPTFWPFMVDFRTVMLMYYNKQIKRLKVYWKLSFLPFWNQLVLTRFFHVLGLWLEKEMATHSSILAWGIPWSVVGYSSWGRKESDMIEQLHFHFHYGSDILLKVIQVPFSPVSISVVFFQMDWTPIISIFLLLSSFSLGDIPKERSCVPDSC